MSHVTSVIITTSCGDSENAMATVNEWLTSEGKGVFTNLQSHAGGYKAWQVDVWGGAFNYLDIEGFAKALRSAPWHEPESVSIFINGEHDDMMREVTLNAAAGDNTEADRLRKVLRELGDTPAMPWD